MGGHAGLGIGAALGIPEVAAAGAVFDHKHKKKKKDSSSGGAGESTSFKKVGESDKDSGTTMNYDTQAAQRASASALGGSAFTGRDNTGYVKQTLGA